MGPFFMLALVVLVTAGPLIAYVVVNRRRPPQQRAAELAPARGPYFYAVDGYIRSGRRAPDAHTRQLVREEIGWRREQDAKARPRGAGVAYGMAIAYLVGGTIALLIDVTRPELDVRLPYALWLPLGGVLLVFARRIQRGDGSSAAWEAALAANQEAPDEATPTQADGDRSA